MSAWRCLLRGQIVDRRLCRAVPQTRLDPAYSGADRFGVSRRTPSVGRLMCIPKQALSSSQYCQSKTPTGCSSRLYGKAALRSARCLVPTVNLIAPTCRSARTNALVVTEGGVEPPNKVCCGLRLSLCLLRHKRRVLIRINYTLPRRGGEARLELNFSPCGRGERDRTSEWRFWRPLPFRLATPLFSPRVYADFFCRVCESLPFALSPPRLFLLPRAPLCSRRALRCKCLRPRYRH